MTDPSAKKLTLLEMSQLVENRFIRSCRLMSGSFAGETWLLVEPDDLEGLKQIAATLAYLAPHADTIRRAIAGAKT